MMNNRKYMLALFFVIASLLGFYAQEVGNFYESMTGNDPFLWVMISTLFSIGIFIFLYIKVFIVDAKEKFSKITSIVHNIGLFIAIFISVWSLFVLFM